jgi:excisionase family DNA binding protein
MVKHSPAAPAQPQMALTIPAVAEQLGCSRAHVYRLIAAGELHKIDISSPGSKTSKTRVPHTALAAYLARQGA